MQWNDTSIRDLAQKVHDNLNSQKSTSSQTNGNHTRTNENTKPAGAKKKPKAVTISMKGLLGDREADKAYTQALLLVYGVLSVTVDPVSVKNNGVSSKKSCHHSHAILQKNERVIIYTNRSEEIRHKLVEAIEEVKKAHGPKRTESRQPLGDLSASYLDDEEEDDYLGRLSYGIGVDL